MATTLLLRLAGPLQAWGYASKFERRTTGREPTKSGVAGLLAAALGRGRNDPIDDLASLRYGVFTEKPGQLLRDYHTAASEKHSYVTERYYLADASFVAGLEGDIDFLQKLEAAVKSPVYPLFLGRRSCPPAGQLCIGIEDVPLEQALEQVRKQASEAGSIIIDADFPTAIRRRDVPRSFSQSFRMHDFRYIAEVCTHHDAFKSDLEGYDDTFPD